MDQKLDRRFRAFGRFLQGHEFRESLTWEVIEAALPELGPTNRMVPKQIRASLLDLGHLLASQDKLESRKAYIARRNALLPIETAPQEIQPVLKRYAAWLGERRTKPANIRDHMEALAAFWYWCYCRGIRSSAEVQAAQVKDYVLSLYWQWQCSECRGTAEFDAHDRTARPACSHCASLHSLTKVKRYAQNTVRGHRAKLLVFFDWCTRERMAVANPVQVKVPAPVPTIRHYPVDVVRQLCAYVAVPDADPTEALMLYLILFHALSVQELRDARIPIIRPLRQDSPVPGLAEAYYLLLPKPPPSLGDHSPGRPDVRLDFPGSAASWLRPLLDRFEWQRKEAVQNPANDYLFVSAASARRDMPVGNVFIWNVVRRASLRLLGGSCSPNTLRKSVGILFADRAGAGILRWMGWDDHQAFAYTWADRELVHPRRNENAADGPAGSSQTDITFPSLLGGTS